MKKSITNIADEELLKLLDNLDDSDEESVESFDTSVLAFVTTFNLKPGKDRIVKKQLYRLYKLWNKGLKKLTQPNFTLELGFYLTHTTNYYMVNKSLFDIASFVKEEKTRKTRNKAKSKHWHNHFKTFLQDTKLEEGTYYIELEILYFLYQQWRTKKHKVGNIGRKQFIKILDIFFDVKAISSGTHLWVGVNEQIMNLISKKEVDRWRKTRAKEKKRFYYPQGEWKKFALYWEEKESKINTEE